MELKRNPAKGQPVLIYAFVARETAVLADHVEFSGSFIVLSDLVSTAVQKLGDLPPGTYRERGFTFDYLVHNGFTFGVVADDAVAVEQQVPQHFLHSVKEEFTQIYGGGETGFDSENSFSSTFGSKLKEHMCYHDDPIETSRGTDINRKEFSDMHTMGYQNADKVLVDLQDEFIKVESATANFGTYLKQLNAKKFSTGTTSRKESNTTVSTSHVSAQTRKPLKSRDSSSNARKVALVYSEEMLDHRPPSKGFDEVPERLIRIVKKLKEEGLWERCEITDCGQVDKSKIKAVHGEKYVSEVEKISPEDIPKDKDMYYSNGTTKSAFAAAGGVLKAVDLVAEGAFRSSFAIVRPPGHHAKKSGPPAGYCFFNNIAIGATHLLEHHSEKFKRILIVDWDVHHGDGTQEIFYNDRRVLFFSLHRTDGDFYPRSETRDVGNMGGVDGLGYNVNISWPHHRIRDVDFIAVWDYVLLPLMDEFKPDIILISAGFDAGKYDVGACDVTPHGFSTLLRKLTGEVPIVMVLEGGYNLSTLSSSVASCVRALLGDRGENVRDRATVYDSTWKTILEAREHLKCFWKVFAKGIPEEITQKSIPAPKPLGGTTSTSNDNL